MRESLANEAKLFRTAAWLIKRRAVSSLRARASINSAPGVRLIAVVTSVEAYEELSAQDLEFGLNETRRDRLLRTLVRNVFRWHLNEIFSALRNEYTDWERAAGLAHNPLGTMLLFVQIIILQRRRRWPSLAAAESAADTNSHTRALVLVCGTFAGGRTREAHNDLVCWLSCAINFVPIPLHSARRAMIYCLLSACDVYLCKLLGWTHVPPGYYMHTHVTTLSSIYEELSAKSRFRANTLPAWHGGIS